MYTKREDRIERINFQVRNQPFEKKLFERVGSFLCVNALSKIATRRLSNSIIRGTEGTAIE